MLCARSIDSMLDRSLAKPVTSVVGYEPSSMAAAAIAVYVLSLSKSPSFDASRIRWLGETDERWRCSLENRATMTLFPRAICARKTRRGLAERTRNGKSIAHDVCTYVAPARHDRVSLSAVAPDRSSSSWSIEEKNRKCLV